MSQQSSSGDSEITSRGPQDKFVLSSFRVGGNVPAKLVNM